MTNPFAQFAQQPENPFAQFAAPQAQPAPVEEPVRTQASRLPEGSQVLLEDENGGIVYELPDGARGYTSSAFSTTDPERIDEILGGADAGIERSMFETIMSDYVAPVGRKMNIASEGLGRGVANLVGAPADLMDASPMLLNLLPGEQGMSTVSGMAQDPEANAFQRSLVAVMQNAPMLSQLTRGREVDGRMVPAAGSESIRSGVSGAVEGGMNAVGLEYPDTAPRDMPERFLSRIAEEVGASVLPLGIMARGAQAAARAAPVGSAVARTAQNTARAITGRELGLAASAGAGAQISNELFTEDGEGTFASDLGGSLAGSIGVPTVGALTAPVRNIVANATNPMYATDTAKRAIVDQVASAADTMRGTNDTSQLADALRQPSQLEQAIPGYRAGAAERTGDRGLAVFEDDVNRVVAGPQSRRAQENTAAVNTQIDRLAPEGDTGRFRLDLERGVEASVNDVIRAAEDAQSQYTAALRDVTPQMDNAAARGSVIRQELAAKRDAALAAIDDMYRQVRESGAEVDLSDLRQRLDGVEARFRAEELNTLQRFRPDELDTIRQLVPDDEIAALAADPSAAARAEAEALFRPNATTSQSAADEDIAEAVMGPVSQALDMQSGLRATSRAPGTTAPQRRINEAFDSEIDEYLLEALDPDQARLLEEARIARSDVGRRFEEPDAIGRTLNETGRGEAGVGDGRGFRVADEAVPGQFIPVRDRNITDYGRLKAEVGAQPRAIEALQDQIVADAQRAGALESPTSLRSFLEDRNIILNDFPELRGRLERAGATKANLDSAVAAQNDVTRDLAPGGRSAEGQFLRFDRSDVRGSINNLIRGGDSGTIRQRTRDLIDRAGTDTAQADLRRGFWEWLDDSAPGSGQGRLRATDEGAPRWNPKKMVEQMRDPKVRALAEELFPGEQFRDFEALEEIFSGLEAATPGRTRAPGSSGTAQALNQSLEAQGGSALTARRLSADVRNVSSGRASRIPLITSWVVDGLRNMSVARQQASINKLLATVANDPGALANILEDFNPAVGLAGRQALTQKYGIRATQVLEVIDEIQNNANPPQDEEPSLEDMVME